MVIVATLLCAAIGFVISAFGLFALALLSVVGPLFVAALLFESTRGYFFAWLGACINYLMLIVFALVLTLFRSEEHTSEPQSLMHISYAVFCLKKKKTKPQTR